MNNFSAKKSFEEIRNFLAGRFLGATRDEFFLEEVIKLIFTKYELLNEKTKKLDDIELSSLYRTTFQKVVQKNSDIYSDVNCQIELDPISIKFIDNELNKLDITNLRRDIIGDAYEIFMGDIIKGQSGQFFTPQNAAQALVKMINPSVDSKILDLTCGAGGFLIATLNNWIENNIDTSKTKLYGVDKDNFLVRLAKIHLACMGQSTKNIKCADSLVWDESILGKRDNTYDVILTNPPFGVNIKTGTSRTLSKFELAYKYKINKKGETIKETSLNESVPPQVVFVEQCLNLLKNNGVLGIVVPESLISSKKYSYVVDFILKNSVIKAIIGMPDELFKTSGKSGTHTKTCLMILQKKQSSIKDYSFFMAEAKWCGHDSRGKEIPHDDIPQIVFNYEAYLQNKLTEHNPLGFEINIKDLSNKVLAPRAYLQKELKLNTNVEKTHTMISIGKLIEEGVLEVRTGNEVGKLSYGTGNIPFIRTSDISNWEIKADPKHLLNEDVYNSISQKQDVQPGDILMVKDGSYLIGTCAMVTEYDKKIVYQSHLYKIRVFKNKYNLNNYYLLAVLSSDFLKNQITANTFSQDIINSLGDRLKDLIIPIANDPSKINDISDKVKKSITESIEARELAKQIKKDVFPI